MSISEVDHPEAPADHQSRAITCFALLMLLAFVSVITARLFDTGPLRSANDRSRWCTVWSLVEEGTYQIDTIRQKPGWDSIDIVRHNGHFYSTKPALLPRLVAEVYRFVKVVTGLNLTEDTDLVAHIILFFVNILPMAVANWMIFGVIRRHCASLFGQIFLMTAVCWATLLTPFLTVFNNHTVGTTFIIYSLVLAISIVVENKETPWRFAVCGLCAAFGVCNELPAAAYGLALFFILLKTNPKQTMVWFVPMALIPLGGFFLTTYHATGGWKPFYLYYGTEKYRYVFEGRPSYWLNPQGLDQAKDSPLVYFMHCTIGHHGILSLTPIYLLTLASWLTPNFWWKSKLRIFHLLGIALSVIVISFYMTKTENYNYGGVSVALRWVLWLSPFWLLSMIPLLNRFGSTRLLQIPVLVCLCLSIFSAWYPQGAPWTQPWLYRVMDHWNWVDYSSPRPEFEHRVYSWIGSVPEGDVQPDYEISFSSQNADGTINTVRLQDAGPAPGGLRKVIVTRDGNSTDYLFDQAALSAGQPVSEFVRRAGGEPLTETELKFFYGVPKRRPYASSRIRHVDVPLRRDAFRCHIGYTYVDVENEAGRTLRYQRDVWFSEEVPFGVLQWEDRIIDPRTKETLSRILWKPTETGKFLPLAVEYENAAYE